MTQPSFSADYLDSFRADIAHFARHGDAKPPAIEPIEFAPKELEVLGNRLSLASMNSQARARSLVEAHQLAFRESPLFSNVTLLDPLGQSRRELSVTTVLAWLLDPRGTHEFGDVILRALLAHLGEDSETVDMLLRANASELSVFTEFTTDSRRRADIVITNRRAALVIEAKVDAKEGVDQTSDYAAYFSEKFDNVCFVFLAPLGVEPKSGDFKPLRYLELCRVLMSALPLLTSSSGFHYARYFLAGLLTHIAGVRTSNSIENVLAGDCIKIEMLLGGNGP